MNHINDPHAATAVGEGEDMEIPKPANCAASRAPPGLTLDPDSAILAPCWPAADECQNMFLAMLQPANDPSQNAILVLCQPVCDMRQNAISGPHQSADDTGLLQSARDICISLFGFFADPTKMDQG